MPQELEFIRTSGPRDSADEPFAFQGADAAPNLRHRKRDLLGDSLEGRPGPSVSTRKLQQASKDQFLGRKEIGVPQYLRRNERPVEEAERVEDFSYLEAEIGSALLTRGPETSPGRSICLLAVVQTFRYTLGSDRDCTHGFTKTFLI